LWVRTIIPATTKEKGRAGIIANGHVGEVVGVSKRALTTELAVKISFFDLRELFKDEVPTFVGMTS
jgi:hypothetical protein